MFVVEVTVPVQGSDGILGLSRCLDLPFAPFPGLNLYGITAEPDFPETIQSVAWEVAGIRCYVELEDGDCPEETLAELLDYYGPPCQLHEPRLKILHET